MEKGKYKFAGMTKISGKIKKVIHLTKTQKQAKKLKTLKRCIFFRKMKNQGNK